MSREEDDAVIEHALKILKQRTRRGADLTSSDAAQKFLTVKLSTLEHESFYVVFMDTRHRLIEITEISRGTIDRSTVHAREVVKAALTLNASAVIFCHNHPSGVAEPSMADKALTKNLADALNLIDVRVLDHFIVASGDTLSFADKGLM